MRRLFILCGLSFAGKTTVARTIADRLGAEVVSLDEINRERGLPGGGEGLPVEAWAETHHLALARLQALMGDGRDLVVDDTCCFRFLRDDYRRLAASHDYTATLVVVDTPLEESSVAAPAIPRRASGVRSGTRCSRRRWNRSSGRGPTRIP